MSDSFHTIFSVNAAIALFVVLFCFFTYCILGFINYLGVMRTGNMMERRIEQIKCYWWLYVILLWPYAYLSINQFPPPFSINQIDELLLVFVGFYMLTDTLVVRHWNKVKRARKDDFDSSTYNTRGDNYKQRRDGGSNSNSNDQSSEYDFDSARWDKSRFDDERYEKKYQSIYRAAHDPKTAPEERKRYFNALVDADSGKMKGIKALPAPN